MLYNMSFEPRDLTEIAKASNEVNAGKWSTSGDKRSLTRKPRPPPEIAFEG